MRWLKLPTPYVIGECGRRNNIVVTSAHNDAGMQRHLGVQAESSGADLNVTRRWTRRGIAKRHDRFVCDALARAGRPRAPSERSWPRLAARRWTTGWLKSSSASWYAPIPSGFLSRP